jgi:hypothetical protein
MKLSPEDAELFYKLMWPLQFYVNQQCQILPDVDSLEGYIACPQEDKLQVRNALYENIGLLNAFVTENLAQLSADELAIVQRWKRFVAGEFYIVRFLKKATIFVNSKDPPQVYAVLGLIDSLEDVFYGRKPPILIRTVLLPFKGRIIYDGMLNFYNIFFGSGIRGNLKEIYMAAKQNQRIIGTLEPEQQPPKKKRAPRKPPPDWRPVVDDLVETAKKLKGGQSPVQSPAFSVLKASARLAQAAVHDPDDLDALWELGWSVQKALRRLETVLDRAER